MSVRNLIEKYSKEYAENIRDYNQVINDRRQELYANIITDLKQIDEPEKVVLPKIAADFIEKNKELYNEKIEIIEMALSYSNARPDEKFSLWFKSNGDLFVDAVPNGYEAGTIIHDLKISSEYYGAVVSGEKRFEIRRNDRAYQVGDVLRLQEYKNDEYTGFVYEAEITYITDYAQREGYVVLGLSDGEEVC